MCFMTRLEPSFMAIGCALALAVVGGASTTELLTSSSASRSVRFEISVAKSARPEPLTGRAFVIVTLDGSKEPRLQIGRLGVPFFGRDVVGLPPGQALVFDRHVLGYPIGSMVDLPPGDYFVQAAFAVYSEFRRSDGHTVWLHDDEWEGQRWNRSPSTLISDVRKVTIEESGSLNIALIANRHIPPTLPPPDTEYVRRFRFKSRLLTAFWGRPIFLGATVLLPPGYERDNLHYPVDYDQGHFSLGAPYGFDTDETFAQAWTEGQLPPFVVVTFQHPTPYFDASYAVNSQNVGPYGDAIMQELIPEVERRFRTIRQPYARIVSGGSTGGWEAMALQVFHPDFFGAAWIYCPDPITFGDLEGVNIYEDRNAFYKQYNWRTVPTVNSRIVNGQILLTSQQRNQFELVQGTRGRSGEQFDGWSAVFGPVGTDGYPTPIFDKRTGQIDADVARYWKHHYDLMFYVQRHWQRLGPKLDSRLFFFVGNTDTYFLNNAVEEFERWLATSRDPHAKASFVYGDRQLHCWTGPGTIVDRLREMALHVARHGSLTIGTSPEANR